MVSQMSEPIVVCRMVDTAGLFAATASAAAPASKWALLTGGHWIPCKGGS
jgi:hypothetical protein